jgi:hypothetical protein
MASSEDFVEYFVSGISGFDVTYKKMFGEYMVYLNKKPCFLICDNTVFVKKYEQLRDLADFECGCPYDGAKEHYILDFENSDILSEVASIVESLAKIPVTRKKYTNI